MLFSGGACSRRVSLFKAVLFSAKMRKAREREREKSWELGESGRILSSSLFCFVWNAAGGRKEAKKKFDSKSFLEMKKKNEFCMSEMFFFLFSFFFYLEKTRTNITVRYSRRETKGGFIIKTLTLKRKSIITPENVSLVKSLSTSETVRVLTRRILISYGHRKIGKFEPNFAGGFQIIFDRTPSK